MVRDDELNSVYDMLTAARPKLGSVDEALLALVGGEILRRHSTVVAA